jgi:putative solute:sodium symporter small subunit
MAYRERLVRSNLSVEENEAVLRKYWKLTLRFTLLLLALWFVAGYVIAIVLAPTLNQVNFLGGPLGFWLAQNGAIYIFWLLILVYAVGMGRLDREFDVHDLEA